MKDLSDNYTFIGKPERLLILNYFSSVYLEKGDYFVAKDSSIAFVDNVTHMPFLNLQSYLRNNYETRKNKSSQEFNDEVEVIHGIIMGIYNEKVSVASQSPTLYPLYGLAFSQKLLKNLGKKELSHTEKAFYEKFQKLTFYYEFKKALIYDYQDLGILIVLVERVEGRINFSFKFIPKIKYEPMIWSDGIYSYVYPDCY